MLLQDVIFVEVMANFDRERTIFQRELYTPRVQVGIG
jgi:hypothetical protein